MCCYHSVHKWAASSSRKREAASGILELVEFIFLFEPQPPIRRHISGLLTLDFDVFNSKDSCKIHLAIFRWFVGLAPISSIPSAKFEVTFLEERLASLSVLLLLYRSTTKWSQRGRSREYHTWPACVASYASTWPSQSRALARSVTCAAHCEGAQVIGGANLRFRWRQQVAPRHCVASSPLLPTECKLLLRNSCLEPKLEFEI